MLPTEDAAWVSRELSRRFGVPYWSFALTATDANRFAIRWARHITGRSKILVHNHCYHGTVDESFAELDDSGAVIDQPGNTGPPVPVRTTTRVAEINDLEALERELAHADVAVCMFEPALTNIGIVLPEPGYWEGVRELCDRTGTLLLIDETHTISAGPGGATKAWGLEPDIVTIGKTLGAGIPSPLRHDGGGPAPDRRGVDPDVIDVGGPVGTLAGNALSLAAMRATLGGSSPTTRSTDDRARRAIRGGRPGGHLLARAPVARRAARMPRGVSLPCPTGRATARKRSTARMPSSTRSSISTC